MLDTTDPATVARVAHECPPAETLFIASSKSGGTIETCSHLAAVQGFEGPRHIAVVTDPGSSLAERAVDEGFRALFENPADIGGRYSALSLLRAGAGRGRRARRAGPAGLGRGGRAVAAEPRPGGEPGPAPRRAAMAGGVKAGRDKLTLVVDGDIDTFGLWLEQLVAESTGKHGTGVIPVAGERLGPPEVYGDDRLFVGIGDAPRARPARRRRPPRGRAAQRRTGRTWASRC